MQRADLRFRDPYLGDDLDAAGDIIEVILVEIVVPVIAAEIVSLDSPTTVDPLLLEAVAPHRARLITTSSMRHHAHTPQPPGGSLRHQPIDESIT